MLDNNDLFWTNWRKDACQFLFVFNCYYFCFIFPEQWIPALKDGRLSLGEFLLPVSLEELPPSYSMLSTEVTEWKSSWLLFVAYDHKGWFPPKIGVISATKSESEESELFHFFRHRLRLHRLRSFHDLYWKPDCWSWKQKQRDKPITRQVAMLCDWFSSSACASDSDSLPFSLDHKLYASDYDSDSRRWWKPPLRKCCVKEVSFERSND